MEMERKADREGADRSTYPYPASTVSTAFHALYDEMTK